jgi:hypothetical protein
VVSHCRDQCLGIKLSKILICVILNVKWDKNQWIENIINHKNTVDVEWSGFYWSPCWLHHLSLPSVLVDCHLGSEGRKGGGSRKMSPKLLNGMVQGNAAHFRGKETNLQFILHSDAIFCNFRLKNIMVECNSNISLQWHWFCSLQDYLLVTFHICIWAHILTNIYK